MALSRRLGRELGWLLGRHHGCNRASTVLGDQLGGTGRSIERTTHESATKSGVGIHTASATRTARSFQGAIERG